ncbi:hypothetical protein [Microbacterium sp. No. 7]|uniref:hypothetical protein n=1 Tax=Microbacterium sp. No. 7 TaxID=1714373 RepID=UPI000AD9BB5F|nr:hypothetical protein [Microbacterium sp. No. 7]
MSRVIEIESGAQVVPNVRDARAVYPEWVAHLACDADLRKKSAHYSMVASELVIES